MKPPEIIQTERLYLRPSQMGDAEAIFAQYAQDRVVTRYMTWRPHTRIQDTQNFLQQCLTNRENGVNFPWVILAQETQELMGMIDLRFTNGAAIGYVLAQPYWGQGYMPEAAQSLVEWAMAQDNIYRIWSVCDVENRASARVLEKIGMSREGILRKWLYHPNISIQPRDCFMYAKIKESEIAA
jgi:RimJ/RimL family protein N-acetyltransferase